VQLLTEKKIKKPCAIANRKKNKKRYLLEKNVIRKGKKIVYDNQVNGAFLTTKRT
jgi:hypothetical protein